MLELDMQTGFKPYYKWITFNTLVHLVLQYLLLRFKPYYKWITFNTFFNYLVICFLLSYVLNLIINGLPSIRSLASCLEKRDIEGFKPYYKWITFNTNKREEIWEYIKSSFKPYYKWITFNTTPVVIRFHYISGIGF